MKIIGTGLCLLALVFFFSCNNVHHPIRYIPKGRVIRKDQDIHNLKGKVKLLTETTYETIKESSGKINEYQSNKVSYYFNEKGQYIKIIFYNEYGSLNSMWQFIYDTSGLKVKANILNSYNKIQKIEYYKYGMNGYLSEVSRYNSNDSLDVKYVEKYDGYGNNIEEDVYNSDGSLSTRSTYTYNDSGLKNKVKNYSDESSLENYSEFSYNEIGELSETKYYYHNSLPYITFARYQDFDEFKNWHECFTFTRKYPQTRIVHEIEYYK